MSTARRCRQSCVCTTTLPASPPTRSAVTSRYPQIIIPVDGMDCSDCVTVLEHGVGRIEGVLGVSVSYAAQKMRVECDSQRTSYRAIERRLNLLCYDVP